MDISFCAELHFGSAEKIPSNYMVYYTGDDADSKLNFLSDNESWAKEGVKYASKILHNTKSPFKYLIQDVSIS
jgi:hypothetical protein